MKKRGDELTPIGDLLTPKVIKRASRNVPTPIQQRLIDTAVLEPDEPRSILYQHAVLCQTCLPYRDPGDEIREWQRLNGSVHLEVIAGKAMHPKLNRLVLVGLPFGPKARLVLMHLNQRALVTQSPEVEMDDSLTAFVHRVLKLASHGRNMRAVKEQLARLAAASIRLGVVRDGHAITVNSHIITQFDIWWPKDERQRVLWPSTVRLSTDYFQSLLTSAVPLDEHHIAALSHSALGLDLYAWLAQRLHRVPPGKPSTISWPALHSQFGQCYGRLTNFRRDFMVALKEVLAVYKSAKIDLHEAREAARPKLVAGRMVLREPRAKGLTLHHSPPPVKKLILA
jgi:hypothetical protein